VSADGPRQPRLMLQTAPLQRLRCRSRPLGIDGFPSRAVCPHPFSIAPAARATPTAFGHPYFLHCTFTFL